MKRKRIQGGIYYFLGIGLFVGLIFFAQDIKVDAPDREILGNFIEWFGILFSVLLALIIVQVWTKYNTVDTLIDKEADAFASLMRFAWFLENPKFLREISEDIVTYCTNCLKEVQIEESDCMAYQKHIEKIFSKIIEAIRIRKRPFVSQEIVRCFDEAIDARGDRDALVKERIPGVLWFMMIFSSIIWLLGFFWLAFQNVNVFVAGFMLLSTTFTVVGLLFIAKDIDNPISGIWKISYKSFEDTCREINFLIRQNVPIQEHKLSNEEECK